MDSDLIYAKTASGEAAVQQRTRVMQRNVRMILILVDGQSTVADLCAKTGNQKLTETALGELEKSGLIVLKIEQDSIWAESKRVAKEIREAAIGQLPQLSLSGSKTSAAKNEPSIPQNPQNREFVQSIAPSAPAPTGSDLSLSQFSITSIQAMPVPGEGVSADLSKNLKQQARNNDFSIPKESKPSFLKRLLAKLTGPRHKAEKPVAIKLVPRVPKNSMGWRGRIALTIVVLLALIVGAGVLFPYDTYFLPDVETAFAQACGRPVKVGSMQVSVYPKPGVFLSNVRIGTTKDEIHIAEIRLLPDVNTLMKPKKFVQEAVLSGVTLSAETIAGFPSVFAALTKPDASVGVKFIRLEKSDVSFHGLKIPDLEGDVKLSADGVFKSVRLQSSDRSLSIEAVPIEQRIDVSLEGIAWRSTEKSAFVFDSFNLKGDLEKGVFTIKNMDLRLFDGVVKGVAVIQTEPVQSISGELAFERINSTRLGTALGIGPQFVGDVAGKLRFLTTSDSWSTIFSAINADGDFSFGRGSVGGIDLAEAVRRVSDSPVQGGTTVFEQLTGKIKLMPSSYQFAGLALNSGLMQSTGAVEVDKDLNVKGRMELQMRGTVNQTRVPITIGGPLKAPLVTVGKRE